MLVYHGSYMEIKTPDIDYGRFNLDFGKGFYVTTLREQAEKWAPRRAKAEKRENAFVSIYEFNTNGLNLLSFDGYTEDWLYFVLNSRAGKAQTHQYDAVYGGMADDEIAPTINYYLRLLEKGRIGEEDKNFFIRQLSFSKPNNQYCITTQKGINALKFIESYKLGD
ncbi:MAG: DUF3990 domain-containing protein [Oscillospiraceae bacterium]|nr:DUF3990 domain-containing protein [Oscillospiraceae bacterium]